MRSTSLVLVALAMVVGACSDSSGPKAYDATELRVRVVSGDGQSGQVESAAGASQVVIPAGVSAQVAPGFEVLDRPLVVQLETETGQRVMGASVPSGMRAAWIIDEPGCGRPFHGDTDFDADGQATNLWIVGTKAGVDCEMYAGRIVGGQVVIDSVFVAGFEPGPAIATGLIGFIGECGGIGALNTDTLNVAGFFFPPVADAYGNSIPWEFQPFPESLVYTLTEDRQTIIAAPGAVGIDSASVLAHGASLGVLYVYVHHPATGERISLRGRLEGHDCSSSALPSPP